jgi:ribonuclease P protein component
VAKLRNSLEFRIVYEKGVRYDSRLMTAFVRRNDCGRHRLGITASRKVARRAVERNRLKRLLREAFRLSGENLRTTQAGYDWVLNAKRSLLNVKLGAVLEDFLETLARLKRDENLSGTETERRSL